MTGLTQRNDSGGITVTAALDKLAAYEDAEAEGRLVRLPCAVGDTVYSVYRGAIEETKVQVITISQYGLEFQDGFHGNWVFHTDSIGKTVFLTREEAAEARRVGTMAKPRAGGEWHESGDGFFDFVYCSLCGHKERRETSLPSLCPACGARMAQ